MPPSINLFSDNTASKVFEMLMTAYLDGGKCEDLLRSALEYYDALKLVGRKLEAVYYKGRLFLRH